MMKELRPFLWLGFAAGYSVAVAWLMYLYESHFSIIYICGVCLFATVCWVGQSGGTMFKLFPKDFEQDIKIIYELIENQHKKEDLDIDSLMGMIESLQKQLIDLRESMALRLVSKCKCTCKKRGKK